MLGYKNMKATYIIFYTSQDGYSDGYTVIGTTELREAIKWLHSSDVKATDISIYKEGKNFENDPDDIIECYKYYWK